MDDFPRDGDERRPDETTSQTGSDDTLPGEQTAPLWSPGGTSGGSGSTYPGPSSPPPTGQPVSSQPPPYQPAHYQSAPGQSAPGQPPAGPPPVTTPLTTQEPASGGEPGAFPPFSAFSQGGGTAGPSGPVGQGGSPRPKRRRLGLAAGVIAAALVVGGGAGLGSAALYVSNHDSSTDSAGSGESSSSIVNEDAPTGSVEKVAADVLPSVVKIEVSGSTEAGSGSGIILSSDGEILTNNHVVEVAGDDGTIKIDFNDGSSASAKVLGTDPLTDTALVKAENVSGLTPATIGKSSKLVVGQEVVAIGSPFGLDSTVTSGIVSALNRPVNVGQDSDGNATVYPAIQTDAAINPGNSGGALVDLNGNVVGINASIQSTSSSSDDSSESGSIGLGFAIPMDEVVPIIKQMEAGETPTHARLGVSVQDASQASAESDGIFDGDGAKVKSVTDGSPAATAGIEVGDVITKVDSQLITSSDSLVATIRSYRPDDKAKVTWTHDGKTKSATITLESDGGSD
ncbi:MAG: trypsin-like peptidase domain-containing protein [Nocardioides sp.]|uniref:S1C family serine protease n=1 Tax=Nocardioides sp. TaxID=35761 RepID=UPI0039E6E114